MKSRKVNCQISYQMVCMCFKEYKFYTKVPIVKCSSILKIQWQQCLHFPLQSPTTSYNLVKLSRSFSRLSSICICLFRLTVDLTATYILYSYSISFCMQKLAKKILELDVWIMVELILGVMAGRREQVHHQTYHISPSPHWPLKNL